MDMRTKSEPIKASICVSGGGRTQASKTGNGGRNRRLWKGVDAPTGMILLPLYVCFPLIPAFSTTLHMSSTRLENYEVYITSNGQRKKEYAITVEDNVLSCYIESELGQV